MKQKALQILFGYWNEVRAQRLAPRRLEIEPSRIAAILSETFMLERVNAGTYPYRLAGTRLCELFGSELRGTNFLSGWGADDRVTIERHLTTLCEQGAAIVLTIEGSVDPRHRLEFEALLLPLIHTGNTVGRVIGVMSTNSLPPWLHGERLTARRLVRHEVIWPDGRPHAVVVRSGQRAPFMARPGDKTDRRKFRVLDGGRTGGGKGDKR